MRVTSSSRNSLPGNTAWTKLTKAIRILWVVRTSVALSCTSIEKFADVAVAREPRLRRAGREKRGRSSNAERDFGPHGDRHQQRRQAGGTKGTPSREP